MVNGAHTTASDRALPGSESANGILRLRSLTLRADVAALSGDG